MNQQQIVAIVHAYTDLQRLITAIDSESAADMCMARELALCTLVDLAREFPVIFGRSALDEMRQLRDNLEIFGTAAVEKARGAA